MGDWLNRYVFAYAGLYTANNRPATFKKIALLINTMVSQVD